MVVLFSTVRRNAPLEQGGQFVKLNWENKQIENHHLVTPANFPFDDPNPRGNGRGARGIAQLADMIIVVSYHTIKIYDKELNHQRDISHPLFAGLHEVFAEDDQKLWVTSTAIDAALLVDLSTGDVIRQVWPREISAFQQRWNLVPLDIDKDADNRIKFLEGKHFKHPSHLHLNAIATWNDEVYAFFNRFGAIVNLDRREILIEDSILCGGHNLLIVEDGTAFVNCTRKAKILIYDLTTRQLIDSINLLKFSWVRKLVRRHQLVYSVRRGLTKLGLPGPSSKPLFVRGLGLTGNLLFIGITPGSILCIDWQKKTLVDAYCYSEDVKTAIHGLYIMSC